MTQERMLELLSIIEKEQVLSVAEQQELLQLITHLPVEQRTHNTAETDIRMATSHLEPEKQPQPRFVSDLGRRIQKNSGKREI